MDLNPQAPKCARLFRVFGASVIGPMHLQREIPCQDACAYAAAVSDAIVIAVADGLGSAAKSDAGAQLAVSSAFEYCMAALASTQGEETLLYDMVRSATAHAREKLESLAQAEACKLRDLGCTLILAVATGRQLAVAHVGDGAVVALVGGCLSLVSGPGDSEYTNEVVPLTSMEWQDALRIVTVDASVSGIAVFTDGCQRAAFRKVEDAVVPFDKFFNPIFEYANTVSDLTEGANEIAELLASAKLCENSDDDKTLVVGVAGTD